MGMKQEMWIGMGKDREGVRGAGDEEKGAPKEKG